MASILHLLTRYAPILAALIFAAGGAATAAPVHPDGEPENRWYQVEVVLFLDQSAQALNQEDWSADPGEPDTRDAMILESVPEAAAGLLPFQVLPADELELTAEYERLGRSRLYKPVLHTGWRQLFTGGQTDFPPVLIDVPFGVPKDAAGDPATAATGDLAPSSPVAAVLTTPAPEPAADQPEAGAAREAAKGAPETAAEPREGISGTLRLRVSRYLHLDADLLYRDPLPLLPEPLAAPGGDPLAPASPSPVMSGMMADFSGLAVNRFQTYRLNETRRLRRDEIHYFDHPRFGMLVRVSAYEPPPEPIVPDGDAVPLPVPVVPPATVTPQPLR